MRAYRIGTAARLSGVEVATLRNWEKRYRLVVPSRNDGGQRLYSQAQLQQLRLLKRWLDAGLFAREAHDRLREHLGRIAAAQPAPIALGHEQRLDRLREHVYASRREAAALRREAGVIAEQAAATCRRAEAARLRAQHSLARVGGHR